MGDIVHLPDYLHYILGDNGGIQAVQWFRDNNYLTFESSGKVDSLLRADNNIQKHELKELMIMWLALNYPDVLQFDHLESEETKRDMAQMED